MATSPSRPGSSRCNCRAAGEDVTKGRTILKSVCVCAHSTAAAVGRAELQVFEKVRVAI